MLPMAKTAADSLSLVLSLTQPETPEDDGSPTKSHLFPAFSGISFNGYWQWRRQASVSVRKGKRSKINPEELAPGNGPEPELVFSG